MTIIFEQVLILCSCLLPFLFLLSTMAILILAFPRLILSNGVHHTDGETIWSQIMPIQTDKETRATLYRKYKSNFKRYYFICERLFGCCCMLVPLFFSLWRRMKNSTRSRWMNQKLRTWMYGTPRPSHVSEVTWHETIWLKYANTYRVGRGGANKMDGQKR